MEPRCLIVNADDLGLSTAVNDGIFIAHQRGIVTSATLMVRQGAATSAAAALPEFPGLGVGLHLDFGQWDYAAGERMQANVRFGSGVKSAAELEAECRAQLELFRRLLGRDPTHVDSHHHFHFAEPAATVAAGLADQIGVPLRGREVRYEGAFYGQSAKGESDPDRIEAESLATLIKSLPAGWTEIGCHPAAASVPHSSYGSERMVELRTLCDPSVRLAVERAGVTLRSFADLA